MKKNREKEAWKAFRDVWKLEKMLFFYKVSVKATNDNEQKICKNAEKGLQKRQNLKKYIIETFEEFLLEVLNFLNRIEFFLTFW